MPEPVKRAAVAAELADLVRVPSVSGSTDEQAIQHRLAERLQDLGCSIDLWPLDLPALAADPRFPGAEVPREAGWGLVGELTPPAGGGNNGPTVILNAHVDVVPPGDTRLWTSPPFHPRIDADDHGSESLFGRGACDMKGGLVSILSALTTLKEIGLPRRGRVLVQCVIGEEDGGLGTFASLVRGHIGDVAVIPEPTSCNVVCANAGALTFRLQVPGRSVHGGHRLEGVSAVAEFWPLYHAIEALEARRNVSVHPLMQHLTLPYGISIGTVHAGDWASTVPDLLIADGRLGVVLGEDLDDAREALRSAIVEACLDSNWLRDHPATVEFIGGQFASGFTDPSHPLVSAVCDAHERMTGSPPQVHGAPYGSDLRLLTSHGIPTLHYGPGDARHAHAPDERVPLHEVELTAAVLVDVVEHYCT